ncbi:hypothetical protein CQY20_07470 [Mycolicibacterium agri]|uniref:PASTA domain-containing protein n=1 Tax=Mycolicibacterium agri TaxID=36811 RepID=A0A2A7N8N8_MYCAG|nr:hypothetical protein [Mycolicibacterium agri]PEG40415.1 hypothetical protein CQY20_07470 [Mycolicibacterium agri]GFG51877.1 hypothetical protein MAGR_33180 [Mycolicibacterium agri]
MTTHPSLAAAVAGAVAVASLAGAGIADAKSSPNVVGQKYGDASSTLSSAGYKPVVSTTVGDQLTWSNCIVYNQKDRSVPPPPNSRGSPTNQTLLSLNCDAPVASATSPGNSLGSTEGRAAAAAASAGASPTG